MCHYKITIPDYPMQGESRFKATFKDRVLADIEVTYDYSIIDARAFVSEAKYLGKANSNPMMKPIPAKLLRWPKIQLLTRGSKK